MSQPNGPQGYGPLPVPPPKKSSNGCLIALAVVGGLFLVIAGLVAFGFYKFATSKEGAAILAVAGDGMEIALEAQRAPGTKELRGLGCKQAMVVDMAKLERLVSRFDAGAPPPRSELSVMVVCQAGYIGTPPACDDAARTYVAAAGAPARKFAVTVNEQGKNRPVCSSVNEPDGTKVGDFDASSAPALPEQVE